MDENAPTIERELDLPLSPEELWESLTDPDQLRDWLGDVAWTLLPGAPLHVREGETERRGTVGDVEPTRRLSFRWWPVHDGDDERRRASDVEWTLEPIRTGTRFRVVERRASSTMCTAGSTMCQWDLRLLRWVSTWCPAGVR